MRAWQVHKHGEPSDALVLTEGVPVPDPAPGLVRVRIAAAGVGLPDVLMCRGSYPLTPALPFTPGQELVGVVTATAADADVRVGDRVMAVSGFFVGSGAFAAEALAVEAFALPVPDSMPDVEAAGFAIPFHTAWVGLVRRARLQSGETLLVLGGSGGTGSAAVQLGRALGARVIATAAGAERCSFCSELGADVVIDRRHTDIATAVREVTDGRGVDCVYDPVGGAAFHAALGCVAHEGRILAVGFASGSWSDAPTAELVNRNVSVLGVLPSGYDRAFRLEAQRALGALYERGEIRVPVGRAVNFDELPEALNAVAAFGVNGKCVVTC